MSKATIESVTYDLSFFVFYLFPRHNMPSKQHHYPYRDLIFISY